MKNKLKLIGTTTAALLAASAGALAQQPGVPEVMPTKSIGHALLNCLIFASVGIVFMFIVFKVVDKATPMVNFEKELLNHNVAVAIVMAAIIIGLSVIIAASMS